MKNKAMYYLEIYLKMIKKIKEVTNKIWNNGYFWGREGDGIERHTKGFKELIVAIDWMFVSLRIPNLPNSY